MSSSEEDSDEISQRRHAIRCPFITSVLVELSFCMLMSRWMWEGGGDTRWFRGWANRAKWLREALHLRSDISDAENVCELCWLVLAISILARLLVISSKGISTRKSSRKAALCYMFFGTVNWLFYITAYYVGHDAGSKIIREHKVNVVVKEDRHRLHNGIDFNKKLNDCLVDHAWDYSACGMQPHSVCTLAYEANVSFAPGDCVAHVTVEDQPCCISERVKMEKPRITFFGHEIRVSISFMLLKWLAVLLIGWDLRFGYLAANIGTGDFSQTTYLDIMDIIIFSENLNVDVVRNPVYGFDENGKPCKKSVVLLLLLYYTFLLAYGGVVVSQLLYTAFAPSKAYAVQVEEEKVSSEESEEVKGQSVLVEADLESDEGACCGDVSRAMRLGYAVRSKEGWYQVRFADGLEPERQEEVHMENLHPPKASHFEELAQKMESYLTARSLCSGFGDCRNAGSFESRAALWDAARSLFLLQLPLMAWRLWFDGGRLDLLEWAGRTMLITKNAIWGAFDAFKLLSCGNVEAAICGWQPLKSLQRAKDGNFGKVWVGPTGMVAWLAGSIGDARKRQVERDQSLLESHERWVRAEMQFCKSQDVYLEKLEELKARLRVCEEKKQFTFPAP